MCKDSHEALIHLKDVLKLRQEPFVNVRHLPNLVHAVATMESSRNGEDTLVGGINELFIDVLYILILKT